MKTAGRFLKETIGHFYFHPDGIEYVPKEMALKAMNLFAEQEAKEFGNKIIEELEKMSNQYEVIDGCYVIRKDILDNYILTIKETL